LGRNLGNKARTADDGKLRACEWVSLDEEFIVFDGARLRDRHVAMRTRRRHGDRRHGDRPLKRGVEFP